MLHEECRLKRREEDGLSQFDAVSVTVLLREEVTFLDSLVVA